MPLSTNSFNPDVRTFERAPLHLHGALVGHVARSTLLLDDIYDETGRIIIRRSNLEGTGQYPLTLKTALGPCALGSFAWSGLSVDDAYNIDITDLFTQPLITGDEMPYRAWRVRSIVETGYYQALYGPSPTTPTPALSSMAFVGTGFTRVDGGFALGSVLSSGLIAYGAHTGWRYIFNGGQQDIYYLNNFQVEAGYGSVGSGLLDERDDLKRVDGSALWPAFTQTVLTDHDGWRGAPQFYPNHP
jgi:hypothetical protein